MIDARVGAVATAGLPPGPRAPAALQTVRMLRAPYRFLLDCHARYGDWFTVRLVPCGTMVYVADPSVVRDLFAEPAAEAGAINQYMTPVLGRGLLTLDGEAHARRRKWIAPSLGPQRIRDYRALVVSETERELATWPAIGKLALRPRFERLALRVIRRVLLGDRAFELEDLLVRLKRRGIVDAVAAVFGARLQLRGEASRIVGAIDAVLAREIAARRRDPGDDLLSSLIAATGDDAGARDDRTLRDELVTLLFAGHETVATTTAWVFERVLRHPAVLDRLVASPDEAYLDAVLKETMRQRSCLPDVGRKLTAPFVRGGWSLPAGTQLFPAIVAIHMHRDRYPEPELFRPERFLDRPPEPWEFLPFGGGARRCVGAAFAMLEMRAIVTTVLARVRLRAADATPERGLGNGVTIVPHAGALVIVEGRR